MDNPALLFLVSSERSSVKKRVSLSVRGASWWRSPQVFGLLMVSLVLALQTGTDIFGGLERHFYDLGSSHSPHPPSARVAVIAIDDQSIASLGPLPWSRDLHARLIDTLAAVKPKVVVDTVPFFEPQPDRGLVFVQQMKAALASARLSAEAADGAAPVGDPVPPQLAALLTQAEAELDGDARLADSLQQAGNVLLAAQVNSGRTPGRKSEELPPFILKSTLEGAAKFKGSGLHVQLPISRLGAAAAGVGHIRFQPDVDGVLRSEQLLLNVQGQALPSLALLAAAKSQDLTVSGIRVLREGVQLGKLKIATDVSGNLLPQYYPSVNGQPAFAEDSFADVLTGKIAAAKYADKLVIIGVTATDSGQAFAVPGDAAMSLPQVLAHRTSSILQAHMAHQPEWASWLHWGFTVLAVAFVVLGLPVLSVAAAASLTFAWAGALLLAEFGLLRATNMRVPLVLPAALLVIGYVVQCAYRQRQLAQSQPEDESASSTERMMGLALQGQGQLDMAFERFRRIPMHAALAQDMYWLAVDFERQQQIGKAQVAYQCIAAFDANYKDVQERLARTGTSAPDTGTAGSAENPETAARGCDKPGDAGDGTLMLGRYQVVKELGRGAMGEVFLGKDPCIGRSVAIKTMALGQEFEGLDLVEARERFFREAKAAGRLQHPSIVTIFDVGQEGDLAYIAMEHLKGQDLQQHCRRGSLMPVPLVLSIVARVATALDYAHGLQVLHRDIKPSNVMYDRATDTVKITDFGIARITDAGKTRTGLVMGTPSYMSPEQLAGLTLDGRSDLYSLGIMAWQLLTGQLPFRGETMAELMSKIATEQAPDIRQLRAEISLELAATVARLLRKSPQDRHQSGDALAAELRVCAGRLRAGGTLPESRWSMRQAGVHTGPIDLES